jgi:Transmembrane secretion effector
VVRRSRRRTGASRWDLYRDGADASRFVEIFVVRSWAEHLRQHGERLTGTDREFEERANTLADGIPEVQHLFSVRPGS